MSGIKGFPSQQKIQIGQKQYNEFVTQQPMVGDKNALDVIPRAAFRYGGLRTVEANSTDRVIVLTGHNVLPGDFIRFEAASTFEFWEVPVVKVDTNELYLGYYLPSAPPITDTYYVLRYATNQVGPDGTITVSSGPVQFNRDGIATTVSEDTDTPSNNRPLPVSQMGDAYLGSARLDYGVTNVSNAAWTQLIADTGAIATKGITLFDGGGYAMELGIGAAASEARMLLIPPGGFNGVLNIGIPANSRLSIRAVGAALVNLGEIDLNLLG